MSDRKGVAKPTHKNSDAVLGLVSSKMRADGLNESRPLNPFVPRLSPFKDQGLEKKYLLKTDYSRSLTKVNPPMVPNPGNAKARNNNTPSNMNILNHAGAYMRKNSDFPQISKIGSNEKPPFDLNFDFLRVANQFLKNHEVFFSSLNKDNTNFLLEFAKQEKARIFNLSMLLDKFIEKGKVSNIMKTPNVSLPFYQRQILLEQHRPVLFQVTSKLLEQYKEISHTFPTEHCTLSPAAGQTKSLVRKSKSINPSELNC